MSDRGDELTIELAAAFIALEELACAWLDVRAARGDTSQLDEDIAGMTRVTRRLEEKIRREEKKERACPPSSPH